MALFLQALERIPGLAGFLLLNEEGAVLSSGGDLENDEHTANVMYNLVHLADKKDLLPADDAVKKITVNYGTHLYAVTLSNKKLHVIKKKAVTPEPNLINI